MKNRLLLTATAIAAGLIVVPVAPVLAADPAGSETQAGTMAERSTPQFGDLYQLFGYYNHWKLKGLAQDAEIESIRYLEKGALQTSGRRDGSLLITLANERPTRDYGASLTLQTERELASETGEYSTTLNFRIDFTDGSSKQFSQSFTLRPEKQSLAYHPFFDSNFAAGVQTTKELRSIPDGSSLEIEAVPEGWEAKVAGSTSLTVIPPAGDSSAGSIAVAVTYPDSSSEKVNVYVSSFSRPEAGVTGFPVPQTTKMLPPTTTVTDKPTVFVTYLPTTVTQTIPTTVTETASPSTVATMTKSVPTTVVSTVKGAPVTVTNERTIVSEVPVTEKTVVVQTEEPSTAAKVLPVVTVVFSIVAALGGIIATALNIPALRALLPF